jgi:hypothetical protein
LTDALNAICVAIRADFAARSAARDAALARSRELTAALARAQARLDIP